MSTWRPSSPGPRDPTPIGRSLDRVTKSLGMANSDELRGVFGRWPELVGEQVAAHARPRSLRDGALVVVVDDPAWATQLKWLEADLLARLREVVGEGVVHRLEVRVNRP